MIPDKDHSPYKSEPDGNEVPEGELVPVHGLHLGEILGINQPPGTRNVYLVRPDGTHVVETESQIEEKIGFWVHRGNINVRGSVCVPTSIDLPMAL